MGFLMGRWVVQVPASASRPENCNRANWWLFW